MSLTGARVRRLLSFSSVVVLMCGALSGVPVDPARAHGVPAVSYTSAGPVTDGMQLSVSVTGFPAEAAVAVSQCPAGIVPTGPGDCAPSSEGGARLVNTDASGNLQTTLTAAVGHLGASTRPTAWCLPSQPCSVYATTIGGAVTQASTPLLIDPSAEPVLSLRASRKSVRLGKKVRFSGSLVVADAGTAVLQRKKRGGAWRVAARTPIESGSGYSVSLRMKTREWRAWRTVTKQSMDTPRSTSPTIKLKVKAK